MISEKNHTKTFQSWKILANLHVTVIQIFSYYFNIDRLEFPKIRKVFVPQFFSMLPVN